MIEYKQSTAARVPVRLYDESTGAPKTNVAYGQITVTVEQADGSLYTPAIAESDWVERTTGAFQNAGKYTLLLPEAALAQTGTLTYAVAATGARTYIGVVKVVAAEEIDTLSRLGVPITDTIAGDVGNLAVGLTEMGDVIRQIPVNPLLDSDLRLNRLDATVSSRLASADYTPPGEGGGATLEEIEASTVLAKQAAVTAVKTVVDAIPTNPLLTDDLRLSNLDATVSSRMTQQSYTAPDNASVAVIKAKTDNLPADPASNTAVNSRLAASSYTAPDNASIAAIRAKTDNLPADPASESAIATLIEENSPLGSGAGTLELTVTDENGAPIPGATCFMKDKILGIFTANGVSDVDGHVAFAHRGGAFQLLTFKTGVVFSPVELVLGPDEAGTKTLVGSVVVVTPASLPEMCTLHATLCSADGQPAVGFSGTMTLNILPQAVDGTFYRGQQITATSDQNGVIVWLLPRESKVAVQIDEFCPRPYTIQVPDAPIVDLSTIIKGGLNI